MGKDGQKTRAVRRAESVDVTPKSTISLPEKVFLAVIAVMFLASVFGIYVLRYKNADTPVLIDIAVPEGLDLSVLNEATKEDFMEVKGIGDARSDAIINLREAIGGFTDIREIANIDGISDTLLNAIIEHFYGEQDGSASDAEQ